MWKCTEWRIPNRNLKSESESLPITTPGSGGTNETDTPHKYQDGTMGCLVSVDVQCTLYMYNTYRRWAVRRTIMRSWSQTLIMEQTPWEWAGAVQVLQRGAHHRGTIVHAQLTSSPSETGQHSRKWSAPSSTTASACSMYWAQRLIPRHSVGGGSHWLLPFRGIAQRRSVLETCQSVE